MGPKWNWWLGRTPKQRAAKAKVWEDTRANPKETILGLVLLAALGYGTFAFVTWVIPSEPDENSAAAANASPSPTFEVSPSPTESEELEPEPEPEPEPEAAVVTSSCRDKPGDIEDGNYKKDPNPPGGMDLTKVTIQTGEETTIVTYASTEQAVDKTPAGNQSLYRSINFPDGSQLLAKLVGGDWEIAHFTLDGQENFGIEPGIAGKRLFIEYPVELERPFKWYATTEYGRTLYTDLCPEGYKFVRHS